MNSDGVTVGSWVVTTMAGTGMVAEAVQGRGLWELCAAHFLWLCTQNCSQK